MDNTEFMENGPASRTRSTLEKKLFQGNPKAKEDILDGNKLSTDNFNDITDSENEFKTPKVHRKKRSNKGRTPSGNLLSNSVKDIRDFFSQESGDEAKSPINREKQSKRLVERQRTRVNTQIVNPGQPCGTDTDDETSQACNVNILNVPQHLQYQGQGANWDTKDTDEIPKNKTNEMEMEQVLTAIRQQKMIANPFRDDSFEKVIIALQKRDAIVENTKEDTKRSDEQTINTTKDGINTTESKQDELDADDMATMNVKLVMEMFREIKEEIQKDKVPHGAERMQIIEEVQEYNMKQVRHLHEELKREKRRNLTQ